MKNNHTSINIQQLVPMVIAAYHQAGHAAAIYLGNTQKQLPAVHFQITIKPKELSGKQLTPFMDEYDEYSASIEGGRLIQSLPYSFAQTSQHLTRSQQLEYRCALEADVVNLLAGPIAVAKFIAARDGEIFNANLINVNALHLYGGGSGIDVVNQYMACIEPDKTHCKQKLDELFLLAFHFVNDDFNWCRIKALAGFILDEPKDVISYEDIILLLDWGARHRPEPQGVLPNQLRNDIGEPISLL